MKLSELSTGQTGIVVKIHGHGAFRKRLIEMGFVKGHTVRTVLHAPLMDPVKYSILGYEVSLRAAEARLIDVIPIDDAEISAVGAEIVAETPHIADISEVQQRFDHQRHIINVVLIGNPNCGKTTLFNAVSGSKEHTGNYSGVTVDAKDGHFKYAGYTINIIDLPGTYSLTCYSPEELYVRQYLRENTPDVIVNVLDASNLERNLFLSTELIDMDYPMVIAMNMYDELESSGAKLDYDSLGRMIGVPMVPVASRQGRGIKELLDRIIAVYEGRDETVRHVHVNLGTDVEGAVRKLVDAIKAMPGMNMHFSPRYLAIKLLEGDHEIEEEIPAAAADNIPAPEADADRHPRFLNMLRRRRPAHTALDRHHWREHLRPGSDNPVILLRDKLRAQIENIHEQDISSITAAEKYGFVAGALAETYTPGHRGSRTTRVIDRLATNRVLGFPIFFALMIIIFWATFALGQYPMEWIENAVAWLSGIVEKLMPAGPLKDMVADGIIGGVGGVIVFLPNILILFFCISFMEDTGYMARAAFIMDKVMHRIGLHGKSFIPLVMGFGCNVPAIIASRSIESRSSRIITVLINPFMSCSARLPIYVLLIGTFFPGHAALVMGALYFGGIVVAVITARLLRRFLFRKDETPFVMELPPYRLPTFKASMAHTWAKGKEYLKKMGGIILFASIIVWALNYFPNHDIIPAQPDDETEQISDADSYLCRAGKALNPLMQPLGFDWRATVAAMAGVPAKEIVVSTLGVLYTNDEEVSDARLGSRLKAPSPVTGKPDFTPAVALSFMVFVLLYCPCIATITAIARETGSWRYSLFSIVYNTSVAWLAAFVVYRIAMLTPLG